MSTKYLDKAIKILSEEQNLDYDDLGSLERKLINIEDEIFDCFNLAILSGEYCINPEFKEKSNNLLYLLGSSDIFNLPEQFDREADQELIVSELLKNNFLDPLKLGVKILEDISRVLRHTLDINNRNYLGYFDEDVVKYLTDDTFDENSRINIQFRGLTSR
jgi:hypothetical protein